MMTTTEDTINVKYFNKSQLILVNNFARRGRPAFIRDADIKSIDPTHLLPISEHVVNGDFVRATVVINPNGKEVDIDLLYKEFEALPTKLVKPALNE